MAQSVYTPAEAAQRLGISQRTVRRLIQGGELPTVQHPPKPGLKPRTRITAKDLEAFKKEWANVA